MTPILVVEDHPESQRRITIALQNAGYEVDAASNFTEACAYIRPRDGSKSAYAAILSDYRLGNDEFGHYVYQYAWRTLRRDLPPFIGSSTEMGEWEKVRAGLDLELVPKNLGYWDADAIIAKLKELGITP
jgi:CheY-like chemotaxis protein